MLNTLCRVISAFCAKYGRNLPKAQCRAMIRPQVLPANQSLSRLFSAYWPCRGGHASSREMLPSGPETGRVAEEPRMGTGSLYRPAATTRNMSEFVE
jgi:hypothetical protein